MPSLKGRYDGRKILIPIAVLRSDNPTDLTFVNGTALVDTGATSSGVCSKIIENLGLRSHTKRPLVVATEERLVDYFLFRLGLFQPSQSEDAVQFPYVFAETDGFGIRDSGHFDIILGMDVLKQCDLHVSRTGIWELHFG